MRRRAPRSWLVAALLCVARSGRLDVAGRRRRPPAVRRSTPRIRMRRASTAASTSRATPGAPCSRPPRAPSPSRARSRRPGKSVTITHRRRLRGHADAARLDRGRARRDGRRRRGVGTIGADGRRRGPQPYVHLGVRVAARPAGLPRPARAAAGARAAHRCRRLAGSARRGAAARSQVAAPAPTDPPAAEPLPSAAPPAVAPSPARRTGAGRGRAAAAPLAAQRPRARAGGSRAAAARSSRDRTHPALSPCTAAHGAPHPAQSTASSGRTPVRARARRDASAAAPDAGAAPRERSPARDRAAANRSPSRSAADRSRPRSAAPRGAHRVAAPTRDARGAARRVRATSPRRRRSRPACLRWLARSSAASRAARGSAAKSRSYDGSSMSHDANRKILVAPAWPYAAGHRHLGHVAGFGVPSDVVRALPPAAGQRRADGERDGRARHAGDGGRRSERGSPYAEVADYYNAVVPRGLPPARALLRLLLAHDDAEPRARHAGPVQDALRARRDRRADDARLVLGRDGPHAARPLHRGDVPDLRLPGGARRPVRQLRQPARPDRPDRPALEDRRHDAGVPRDEAPVPRPAAVRRRGCASWIRVARRLAPERAQLLARACSTRSARGRSRATSTGASASRSRATRRTRTSGSTSGSTR